MSELSPIVSPLSLDHLKTFMPHILDAPKDDVALDLVVVRPDRDIRELPKRARVTAKDGVVGDHWITGSGLRNDDGTGLVDAQICMMMSRVIEAIASSQENWPPAGDNLFLDMDLTPSNMPPGTRFSIGTAEFVVTPQPHNGCQKFIDRYGRDACLFVNTGEGRNLRLRGIYSRVTRDGEISPGDRLRKIN